MVIRNYFQDNATSVCIYSIPKFSDFTLPICIVTKFLLSYFFFTAASDINSNISILLFRQLFILRKLLTIFPIYESGCIEKAGIPKDYIVYRNVNAFIVFRFTLLKFERKKGIIENIVYCVKAQKCWLLFG